MSKTVTLDGLPVTSASGVVSGSVFCCVCEGGCVGLERCGVGEERLDKCFHDIRGRKFSLSGTGWYPREMYSSKVIIGWLVGMSVPVRSLTRQKKTLTETYVVMGVLEGASFLNPPFSLGVLVYVYLLTIYYIYKI